MRDSDEGQGNVDYLRDTATQPRGDAPFLYVDEIGWNGKTIRRSARERNQGDLQAVTRGSSCWRDQFGNNIASASTRWIEPAWRLLLSAKASSRCCGRCFRTIPICCRHSANLAAPGGPEITKPLFGREGANITAPGLTTEGPYGGEGYVYQQWAPLPSIDGHYPVIGGWIIAGQTARHRHP